ncbi:MAG: phosphocarrier protein HPr [Pseudomonadota bacterium]|jgi:phosphocarrier protein
MSEQHTASVIISNKLGLHARASAKLTQLASQFKSQVFIAKNNKRANAKSIMGVMMLAAGIGSEIVIDAQGDDCVEAVNAVIELFNNKFGESE